jgi:peptide/nickel transport system permease protein
VIKRQTGQGADRATRSTLLQSFFRNKRSAAGFVIFAIFALTAILAPWLAPYNPAATQFLPLQPPSWHHLLGTTASGQDVFSQLVVGSRVSLGIGIGAGVLATLLAVLMGMVPAYLGGRTDAIFSTITNVMLVIPGLPLLIVITAYIHQAGTWSMIFVLGLTGWAWGARVLRSQMLTYVRRDFVVAAKLAGASHWYIVLHEILPNMLSLVVANLMFGTLGALLASASLQFLGLGNPDAISWGTMLFWAENGEALLNGAWWWIVAPGAAVALVGASMALMNFGVDELSNPRLRQALRYSKAMAKQEKWATGRNMREHNYAK